MRDKNLESNNVIQLLLVNQRFHSFKTCLTMFKSHVIFVYTPCFSIQIYFDGKVPNKL